MSHSTQKSTNRSQSNGHANQQSTVQSHDSDGLSHDEGPEDLQVLASEVKGSVERYCRQRPLAAGLGIFLAGIYVGWRVKPW
ncbi:MAG: hypothetical protein Aurels2KO_50190 [Aureliella sp.]